MVTLGGFEPPRGQALDLPPLPGLGYRATGPSGWTRTTTTRVKSPVCCVDTTKGFDSLVRPTGIEPVPPRWRRGMLLHTQAEQGSAFADPPTSCSCQRSRPFRDALVGSKGFEPKRSSWRRAVLQTASGPSARTARVGDSARIRAWTREVWRLRCFRYTTLPLRPLTTSRRSPPPRPRSRPLRVEVKTKKAF